MGNHVHANDKTPILAKRRVRFLRPIERPNAHWLVPIILPCGVGHCGGGGGSGGDDDDADDDDGQEGRPPAENGCTRYTYSTYMNILSYYNLYIFWANELSVNLSLLLSSFLLKYNIGTCVSVCTAVCSYIMYIILHDIIIRHTAVVVYNSI